MPGPTSVIEGAAGAGVGRRSRRRSEVDRVLWLAGHLPREERLLVEQVYRHGRPIAELARLTGRRPRQLQRRLKALVERMGSDEFRFLAGRGDLLPRWVQPIARRRVFEGRTLREVADATGHSLHQVRRAMEHVRWGAGKG